MQMVLAAGVSAFQHLHSCRAALAAALLPRQGKSGDSAQVKSLLTWLLCETWKRWPSLVTVLCKALFWEDFCSTFEITVLWRSGRGCSLLSVAAIPQNSLVSSFPPFCSTSPVLLPVLFPSFQRTESIRPMGTHSQGLCIRNWASMLLGQDRAGSIETWEESC